MDADIAVIGGGIIGTTATLALQDAGMRTITLEPGEVGAGTAEGSAGFLHDGEIFPLPNARLLPELPKMLFDPLGPLVFRPAYLPRMAFWGARFFGAMRKTVYETGIAALADLNRTAVGALVEMASSAGAADLIVRSGGLKVCRDARSLEALVAQVEVLGSYGIASEAVDAAALRALEPGLNPALAGGVYFPNSAHCSDLGELGRRLGQRLQERGNIVHASARRLKPDSAGTWTVDYGTRDSVRVPRVLVAAGHASWTLLRPLGYRVPVAPARGYHLMIRDAGVALQRAVIFQEAHFAATPMQAGLRLAGTMEFAPAGAPPDMRRAENLYELARPYLPGLQRTETVTWMGVRPVTPDDVPIIGRAARHPSLYYSFGHGHLGLTQSATSARSISALIAGDKPPIDLEPFRLSRFR